MTLKVQLNSHPYPKYSLPTLAHSDLSFSLPFDLLSISLTGRLFGPLQESFQSLL